MVGACSDCVRCSIRHRRAGDLAPRTCWPPADIDGTFPVCVYRSRISWAPGHLHFQPLARWAKSVSRSSLDNALAARASLLFTFHTGLPQLFCDFDSDGTCLAGVRACHLRFVSSLSLLCQYDCRPPFNQTLRTLWAAISLSTVLTIQRHTFCLKRDCGIDQPPKYIDIDLDQRTWSDDQCPAHLVQPFFLPSLVTTPEPDYPPWAS
jgi:hypothetical protein